VESTTLAAGSATARNEAENAPRHDSLPADVQDRACGICGRRQAELELIGHTLRFLCPDEVCTSCLDEDAAAA